MTRGIIGNFICLVLGTTYPIFSSFKAIESPEKDDDSRWLTFWVTFASLSILESITDIFESFIPFYFELKLVLLLLLQMPGTKLATVLYQSYIRPYMRTNQDSFEAFLRNLPAAVITALAKLLAMAGALLDKNNNGQSSPTLKLVETLTNFAGSISFTQPPAATRGTQSLSSRRSQRGEYAENPNAEDNNEEVDAAQEGLEESEKKSN
eukprot:TRINITY_DN9299_c0_g1_i1.p1 TRINITY_DN9299_c0_g1~~TRINITY_DN9299_c0_g1_i1.p1  ORF type:complete len:208 (-),score=33.73 TRINITY_DN9299_c0_g1_i1:20-643(-)